MSGIECCAACACLTPLLQRLMGLCGGGDGSNVTCALTAHNICNFMRCGNGCNCCSTIGGNYTGTVEHVDAGARSDRVTVAARAVLEEGSREGSVTKQPRKVDRVPSS